MECRHKAIQAPHAFCWDAQWQLEKHASGHQAASEISPEKGRSPRGRKADLPVTLLVGDGVIDVVEVGVAVGVWDGVCVAVSGKQSSKNDARRWGPPKPGLTTGAPEAGVEWVWSMV